MHSSSLQKMKSFVDKFLPEKIGQPLRILDVGSQDVNGSYKQLFDQPKWQYTGLDVTAGKNVDVVVADIYDWQEIPSNSYDVIISGQALEHIEYFWITIMEISRVLKSHGLCCLIAPSSGPAHRYPVDCYRFFSDGLTALAKYSDFQILSVATDWNNDPDNTWKDSMIVMQKPDYNLSEKIKKKLKNYLAKKILSL